MLPKKFRLSNRKDIIFLKKEGVSMTSKSFGVLYKRNEKNKHSRFGFIVSTKISKKAVERNRVKRMLREAVLFILPQITKEYDILFLASRSMLRLKQEEIKKEVRLSLNKIGII